MPFTKQPNFTKKTTDLPDVPSPTYTPTQIKDYIQNPSDELMTNFNNAIDKLNSTTAGNSGADNIGATGFDGTPSNPQAMLEDLNTRKADKGTDWTGTWQGFNPSQVDQTIRDQVNTNTSQLADNTKKIYEKDIVVDYGADPTGTMDSTSLFQQAINDAELNGGSGRIVIPPNTTLKITAPLVINNNGIVIEWSNNFTSILKKFFNGEIFHVLGGEVILLNCGIDGNGSSGYTGGAIKVFANSGDNLKVINPRIKNTVDSPIIVDTNGGTFMQVLGGMMEPYNQSTPALRSVGSDTLPQHRHMIGVDTGQGNVADFTNMETTFLTGCSGRNVTFPTDGVTMSKKAIITGCRLTTTGVNVEVGGNDHVITGNDIASSIHLNPSTHYCNISANVTVGDEVIDDSGNTTNKVETYNKTYTPTWYASTTAPVIGNGSMIGKWSRIKNIAHVDIILTIGSTTTIGNGTYSFQLPFTASDMATGSVRAVVGGVFRTGICLLTENSSALTVYFDNQTSEMSNTVPAALTNGNTVHISISYPIAVSG